MRTAAPQALNKPLVIFGMDFKMLGLAFPVSAVIAGASDTGTARGVAIGAFFAICWTGRLFTKRDPRYFEVVRTTWRQKALYDPMKRLWFRVVITHG